MLSALSPQRIGAAYVLVGLVIFFSLVVPDTFPQMATLKQVLNTNALRAMGALAIVVPLATGVFDVSLPATMALSGVLCASLIQESGAPIWLAVLIALVASTMVGVVNGLVVVTLKIHSLIGTLATGFLLSAVVLWRTDNRNVSGPALVGDFQQIARYQFMSGYTIPIIYALGIAIALWYLLEHTPTGRRMYATGFNRDAARLASVRCDRLQYLSLVISSTIAGAAGVVLASSIGLGHHLLEILTSCLRLRRYFLVPHSSNRAGSTLGGQF